MITRLRELPWKLIVIWWMVLYTLQTIAFMLGASWLVLMALTILVLYGVYLSVR